MATNCALPDQPHPALQPFDKLCCHQRVCTGRASDFFRINRLDEDKCVDTHQAVSLSFKEVIQPQVPLGLPCYDFTPVMNHKVVSDPPKVSLPTSFATHSHGVTGGVYKARERIHRGILIHDY